MGFGVEKSCYGRKEGVSNLLLCCRLVCLNDGLWRLSLGGVAGGGEEVDWGFGDVWSVRVLRDGEVCGALLVV